MKTIKLIIGIISIVLSVVILLQSCAVSVGDAMLENGETGGSAGIIMAVILLISGIIAIATRSGKGGGIVAGVFYLLGGLLGKVNVGTYTDLGIWSWMCIIFGIVFILGSIFFMKNNKSSE